MGEARKNLGQLLPAANTLTTLYTVGAARQTTCSSLNVCNLDSQPATFRVSQAIEGAANSDKQYLFYDVPIAGYSSRAFTLGMCARETDVIRVQSSNGRLAFNLWGAEASL